MNGYTRQPAPDFGTATFKPVTRNSQPSNPQPSNPQPVTFKPATRIPLKNSLTPTTPPPIFTTFDKILKD